MEDSSLRRRTAVGVFHGTNGFLAAATRSAWPGRPPENPERVCLWRTGNVGDLVCALPVLAAARRRWPDAHLTLLTSPGERGAPGGKELLSQASWIDELLVYHPSETSAKGFGRELRDRRFDVCLRLPQNMTTPRRELRDLGFLRLAVRPRWARGFAVGSLRWLSHAAGSAFAHADHHEHESRRLLELMQEAVGPVQSPEFPLPLQGEPTAFAERLLARHGLDRTGLLAVAPGAKRTTNRWRPERFGEVARRWLATGRPVAILGGPGDSGLGERVHASAGPEAVLLTGQTPLLVSAAILARAAVCLANDSGCSHLAAAVGTPCVVPTSARDVEGRWAPFDRGGARPHRVLRSATGCSPCWLETCPIQNACLEDLATDDVWNAVEALGRGRGELATAI